MTIEQVWAELAPMVGREETLFVSKTAGHSYSRGGVCVTWYASLFTEAGRVQYDADTAEGLIDQIRARTPVGQLIAQVQAAAEERAA